MSRDRLAYDATRITLALVYMYFGTLKFFDGCSPAESLAGETIHLISLKLLSADSALLSLAVFETALGLLLLSNRAPKLAYYLFLIHMAGTFTPLVLLPDVAFNGNPLMPTLVGQYIWKNIVYVAAVSAVFVPVAFAKGYAADSTTQKNPNVDANDVFAESAQLTPQLQHSNLTS